MLVANKPGRGRPKRNESGDVVAGGHGIAERLIRDSAQVGRVIAARLVRKSGAYRLLIRLSLRRGECTVTSDDGGQVREWRSADQALKRLSEVYGYDGPALVEYEDQP